MSRFTSLQLLALSLAASFSLFLLPNGALASPPFTVDVSFVDPAAPICDVSTTLEVSGTQTVHLQKAIDLGAGTAYVPAIVHFQGLVTYTSNVNGQVLTATINNISNDMYYTQVSDTVFAFTYSVNGVPQRLHDGNRTLLKDSGRVVFTDTWDLHDLANPDDDEFLGGQIDSISGPHPQLDGSTFCNTYVPIMTV